VIASPPRQHYARRLRRLPNGLSLVESILWKAPLADKALNPRSADDQRGVLPSNGSAPSRLVLSEVLLAFKAAVEAQTATFEELNERLTRLEKNDDVQTIRADMRELFNALSALAIHAAQHITRAEGKTSEVAVALEELRTVGTPAEQMLARLSKLEESVAEAKEIGRESRMLELQHIGQSIDELRENASRTSACITTLADDIETLHGQLASATKESRELATRLQIFQQHVRRLRD
jgi:uncharacterized coiled-coil DUF342 family protein